ncbi:MAG TPA: methyltransferase [Bryobacteraceae bacterium]|nr:methyltransferase [Bryobacteraceae bacterium]
MEPFRFHALVCNQQKAEGVPSCYANGSARLIDALRREIANQGLDDEVQVTVCGSLGLCEHGPTMVVYPEGTWYSGVKIADVPEIVDSHFRNGIPVDRLKRTDVAAVRSEVLGNRDKMRAALRQKDTSGALPDDLNVRIGAFQESRIILTALELDVFTAVGERASAAEVAASVKTDARATEMLLNALTAVGLLSKQGGWFQNSAMAARFLSTASPDCARSALLHTANLWKNWSNLTECVRAGSATGGGPAGDYDAEASIAAMHRNARERLDAVVKAAGVVWGRMLEIGGGSGIYSIAFAQANPQLEIDLLDEPEIEPIARSYIRQAGVESRVRVLAGDATASLPQEGYDLVLLSSISHSLGEEENFALLKRCFVVLVPHGRIIIQDSVLNADKTGPKSAALLALNMLTGTRSGRTYSEQEYTTWLEATGFQAVRHVRLPGSASLILATRE